MTETFNPYSEWLDIPLSDQPADHYRLLGVSPFEDRPDLIESAAEARMKHLRSFRTGPRGEVTQELLTEIAAAKVCLLNPSTKAEYDASLKQPATKQGGSVPPTVQEYANLRAAIAAPPPSQSASTPINSGQSSVPTQNTPQFADTQANPAEQKTDQSDLEEGIGYEELAPAFYRKPWFLYAASGLMLLLALAIFGAIWASGRGGSDDPPPITEQTKEEDLTPVVPPPVEVPAVVVVANSNGEAELTPANAMRTGGLTLASSADNEAIIGSWTSFDAEATWRFKLTKGPHLRVEVVHSASEAGKYEIEIPGRQTKVRSTVVRGPGKFATDEFYLSLATNKEYTLIVRAKDMSGAELMELKSIRFSPTRR